MSVRRCEAYGNGFHPHTRTDRHDRREFTMQVAANVTAHQPWDCTDTSGAIVLSGGYIVDVAGARLTLHRKVAAVR